MKEYLSFATFAFDLSDPDDFTKFAVAIRENFPGLVYGKDWNVGTAYDPTGKQLNVATIATSDPDIVISLLTGHSFINAAPFPPRYLNSLTVRPPEPEKESSNPDTFPV